MRIVRDDEGGFHFEDVEPQLAQFFLAIPAAANPGGNPEVLARLFPSPTESAEPALREEWAQFVAPELVETFAAARRVVEEDLLPLREGGDGWAIPPGHMEAWLNALNQARLALAARFNITEEDMDGTESNPIEDERGLAVAQIHVYGLLQECLIQRLGEA